MKLRFLIYSLIVHVFLYYANEIPWADINWDKIKEELSLEKEKPISGGLPKPSGKTIQKRAENIVKEVKEAKKRQQKPSGRFVNQPIEFIYEAKKQTDLKDQKPSENAVKKEMSKSRRSEVKNKITSSSKGIGVSVNIPKGKEIEIPESGSNCTRHYGGIGVLLKAKEEGDHSDRFIVGKVAPGYPADEIGIIAGDILVGVSQYEGLPGSEVTVTYYRGFKKNVVTTKRAKICYGFK